MWTLYAKDGAGNAVIMKFEALKEATTMADTLSADGFHWIDLILEGTDLKPV